jgi:hypothetical protein
MQSLDFRQRPAIKPGIAATRFYLLVAESDGDVAAYEIAPPQVDRTGTIAVENQARAASGSGTPHPTHSRLSCRTTTSGTHSTETLADSSRSTAASTSRWSRRRARGDSARAAGVLAATPPTGKVDGAAVGDCCQSPTYHHVLPSTRFAARYSSSVRTPCLSPASYIAFRDPIVRHMNSVSLTRGRTRSSTSSKSGYRIDLT